MRAKTLKSVIEQGTQISWVLEKMQNLQKQQMEMVPKFMRVMTTKNNATNNLGLLTSLTL